MIGYSWAKDIEEDSIELADKEFVDETFKQKRADVIAKARLKNRERLNERQRIEVEKMTKTLLQGGEKMGEFVSNIARVRLVKNFVFPIYNVNCKVGLCC